MSSLNNSGCRIDVLTLSCISCIFPKTQQQCFEFTNATQLCPDSFAVSQISMWWMCRAVWALLSSWSNLPMYMVRYITEITGTLLFRYAQQRQMAVKLSTPCQFSWHSYLCTCQDFPVNYFKCITISRFCHVAIKMNMQSNSRDELESHPCYSGVKTVKIRFPSEQKSEWW